MPRSRVNERIIQAAKKEEEEEEEVNDKYHECFLFPFSLTFPFLCLPLEASFIWRHLFLPYLTIELDECPMTQVSLTSLIVTVSIHPALAL